MLNWFGRILRSRRPSWCPAPSPAIEALEPRMLLSTVTLTAAQAFEFIDDDGDVARLQLRGPGTATLHMTDLADAQRLDAIELDGTTVRGVLRLSVKQAPGGDGLVTVGALTGGDIGAIRFDAAEFNGAGVALSGSARLVTLASLQNGADLIIEGTRSVRISLGSAVGDTDDDALISATGGWSRLSIAGEARHIAIEAGAAAGLITFGGALANATIETLGSLRGLLLKGGGTGVTISVADDLHRLEARGRLEATTASIGGALTKFRVRAASGQAGDVSAVKVRAAGVIRSLRIDGHLADGSVFAAADGIGTLVVGGDVSESMVLAGTWMDEDYSLSSATFGVANIRRAAVGGNVLNGIIAAGGDPGEDGRFANHEVLPGGVIGTLTIGGLVVGYAGEHLNSGIYASALPRVRVNGMALTPRNVAAGIGAVGTAVIDPLPTPANALSVADIEAIIARAVAEATRLGVNATISLTDREGNILAAVRMSDAGLEPAALVVDIDAGGAGGLEAIDDTGPTGIISTALIAATKAGTAAFLSTGGNAFTTRTAGQIIQRHFPPGVPRQDGGPLFGVQFSSLPTSDVSRLPLGLSADPGGLPLYRGGEMIGGIGIEIDGLYTVDASGIGGAPTDEERVALAAQAGLAPPARIRADNVFIDGIRLDYANAKPRPLSAFAGIANYGDLVGGGLLDELLVPQVSPQSKFAMFALPRIGGPAGAISGEVPDNALYDFFDATANGGLGGFTFSAGDDGLSLLGAVVGGTGLTALEVEHVLAQGHQMNERLRSQIRRDRPQVSRVTVAVVDVNGNLLGAFRSLDAPVFGYDVAVQKARSAAFISRPDAGAELTALDAAVDVATLAGLGVTTGPDPFARHVAAAAEFDVALDGSVAMAVRTIGFLARPDLPDGIDYASPGPLSVIAPGERFSPFNTGLQTQLILPQLIEFLGDFGDLGEVAGLAAFGAGTIGGGGVVPLDSNAGGLNPGGGLPGNSLANGLQIFSGGVPLYRDGVLIGAVGVSGDGVEQDDYVAFAAAGGDGRFNMILATLQDFPVGVTRADLFKIKGGIRLPYVKLPRSPFAGV